MWLKRLPDAFKLCAMDADRAQRKAERAAKRAAKEERAIKRAEKAKRPASKAEVMPTAAREELRVVSVERERELKVGTTDGVEGRGQGIGGKREREKQQ